MNTPSPMEIRFQSLGKHTEGNLYLLTENIFEKLLSPEQQELLPEGIRKMIRHLIFFRANFGKVGNVFDPEDPILQAIGVEQKLVLDLLIKHFKDIPEVLQPIFQPIIEVYKNTRELLKGALENNSHGSPAPRRGRPRQESKAKPAAPITEEVDQQKLQTLVDYFTSLKLPISTPEDFKQLDRELKEKIRREVFAAHLGTGIFIGETLEEIMDKKNLSNRRLAARAFAIAYNLLLPSCQSFFAWSTGKLQKRA